MRHNKYITSQTRLAFLSKPAPKTNIHDQLKETLAEKKRVMEELAEKLRISWKMEWYIGSEEAA